MATIVVAPAADAPVLSLRTESSRSSLSASAESSLSASTSTSLDTPTRSSILRTASTGSIGDKNISFAPLPHIEPRRRKSNVALGVAARSRMLAIRRQLREQGIDPNLASQLPLHFPSDGSPPIPIWEHDPDAELRDEPDDDLGTDPAEEAFAAIGKFVKGATRTLFRRKSTKDVKLKDDSVPPLSPVGGSDKKVPRSQSVEHLFSSPPTSTDPPKDSEEGGVWEEEIGTDTWAQLRARTQSEVSTTTTTTTTTTVRTTSDAAYKRTSRVEVGVVGKKKKAGTQIGRKATATETVVETKTETKAERRSAETKTEAKAETRSVETKVETAMTETTNTMTTTTATA